MMSKYIEGTRYVDMWAFKGLHPSNIELLQRLRMADDRQFGEHMDLCGTVWQRDVDSRRWRQTGVVGIRSDIWSPSAEELQESLNALQRDRRQHLREAIRRTGPLTASQRSRLEQHLERDEVMQLSSSDIEKRRLVLKLFRTTGRRSRWAGTIEEITTREIHNSIGSRRTLLSLAVVLPGYEYVTLIEQNHRTFRIPGLYTFGYCDEKQSRMWYVTLKRKWVSFGADFAVETEGRQVGLIDGKLIGFGYNAHLTVREPALADNGHFMDLVTLFATSVGYHRSIRRSIRGRLRQARRGEVFRHLIEDEEFWMLRNPRRRAA